MSNSKMMQAAAKGESAANVAHNDPNAAPDDHDAHTLHGAKLLNAIATAHVNHLHEAATKKKLANAKRKAPKGVTSQDDELQGPSASGSIEDSN